MVAGSHTTKISPSWSSGRLILSMVMLTLFPAGANSEAMPSGDETTSSVPPASATPTGAPEADQAEADQAEAAKPEADEGSQRVDFDRQIAPLLVSRCLECHAGVEPKGGLSLVTAELARNGGESGAVIVAGSADKSLLWQRVESNEMPPKHPLIASEKSLLRRWIDEGADWGARPLDPFSVSTDKRAGRDWWSLQPLRETAPPAIDHAWVRNEIDAWVWQRLQQHGLQPSPPADPRTLVRRLYFDLIGLPPSPEEVEAFVKEPSDQAYTRMVERLLASPRYGERWGRHWLDVVRFGESDGFERNHPREHAWHYRDWVVRALNNDLPYNEFVQQQLIGDLLSGGYEGAAATGFWVAGVHNTVVGGSQRMKQLARQDELEEVLATVGQTFLGLTIHCARCHDHKFDPVSQSEYYQLASAISGLGYGERTETLPVERPALEQLDQQLRQVRTQLSQLEEQTRQRILAARRAGTAPRPEPPVPYARWEFDGDLRDAVGSLHGQASSEVKFEKGALVLDGRSFVQTPLLAKAIHEKTLEAWLQLDDLEQRGGAAISLETRDGAIFDAIVFGERDPRQWMPGSNNFLRTDSWQGMNEETAVQRPVHLAVVYQADGTILGYRDGVPYGKPVRKGPLQAYAAEQSEVLFGLRHKPPGGNRFLRGKLHRAALYDRALAPGEVALAAGSETNYVSEDELVAALSPAQRTQRMQWKEQLVLLESAQSKQIERARPKLYTLTAGEGALTKVLRRGDPDLVGATVVPAGLTALTGPQADFGLAADAPESVRRKKLAEWITHADNPLFARVIVNRVWHYHFGMGIVETPNDLGFNGGRPSHPELLDYLAARFRADGYRLKSLHRWLVHENTYRQASRPNSYANRQEGIGTHRDASDSEAGQAGSADSAPRPVERTNFTQPTTEQRAHQIDADNRLLWRARPRRLEAEALRDAMLSVSGALKNELGGPSFKDVAVTMNNGTTYYEPIEQGDQTVWRRTIYRFNPRGERIALLDTFDCPDSATTAPRRSVTSTPLQALSLLNSPFVVRMADHFANRVRVEAGVDPHAQVERAWMLAVARSPDDQERQLSLRLVEQHGLAPLGRALFNLQEFVVVE